MAGRNLGFSKLTNKLLLAIGVAFLSVAAIPAENDATKPTVSKILIGPNILVSRDGDVPHCETMVAANPRDPKNLIGGSIVGTTESASFITKPYVSFDGGAEWTDIALPTGSSADPQVGFGITGTAYFMGLNFEGMTFYRSEDGGKTWDKGLNLGKHHDHEMLTTDYTYGPYAGRVYLTDETDVPGSNELEDLKMQRRVVLFRSSDDGRSFIGPIEVARSQDNGMGAENLLVLSDGTLFIPIIEYPNYSTDKTADTWKVVFSESKDGGVTFSPLQTIGTARFGGAAVLRAAQRSGQVDQVGAPVFAVDRSTKFRDRIYSAWTDVENGRFRLMLTWSSDHGKTWTTPKPVEPNAPAYASQFQPMLAVDTNGNLGIMYYDTDGFPKRDRFYVSFTASTDGGATLMAKKRLSSVASAPFGSGDLRPGAFTETERGMVTADFVSAVSRWVDGGDYIGLTASEDGFFHPFWTDARSGTYQLYTAAVRVSTGEAVKSEQPATAKTPVSLTDKITLAFDPISYDQQTGEAVVPIRLKNTSKETLYPPFKVEVKELAHPYMIKSHEPYDPPTFLNASNGKSGIGAVFDYATALGDLTALEPNAVTDAVPWHLKAASSVKTNFHLGVEITGYTKAQAGSDSKPETQ
ncbi:MAG TPA: sialidase family protein [Candidatus Koribacter sp.]|jgi:hypothetical protein